MYQSRRIYENYLQRYISVILFVLNFSYKKNVLIEKKDITSESYKGLNATADANPGESWSWNKKCNEPGTSGVLIRAVFVNRGRLVV